MLISYMRTVILYLLLILVVRVMGKRQIGQMEPTEFVVTMLLANLAAVPMQDNGSPGLRPRPHADRAGHFADSLRAGLPEHPYAASALR